MYVKKKKNDDAHPKWRIDVKHRDVGMIISKFILIQNQDYGEGKN